MTQQYDVNNMKNKQYDNSNIQNKKEKVTKLPQISLNSLISVFSNI